jgi:uncharacterized protein (DUF1330 family)
VTAILVVDTKIHNPEVYEEYKALVRPLVEKMGGTYRARGGRMEVLEDDLWSPTRIVILEFPTFEAATAFVNSDEYAPIKALRHANADSTIVAVELA